MKYFFLTFIYFVWERITHNAQYVVTCTVIWLYIFCRVTWLLFNGNIQINKIYVQAKYIFRCPDKIYVQVKYIFRCSDKIYVQVKYIFRCSDEIYVQTKYIFRCSDKIYVQVEYIFRCSDKIYVQAKYMFKDRIYGTKYSRIDQVKFVCLGRPSLQIF